MPLCSKVNSVKMVIELQFNYISMMIPVNIPDTTFKRCNKIINDFLWAGKRPQIKMSKLCSPRDGMIFLLKRPSWLNTGETDSGWTGLKQNRLASTFHPIGILSQCSREEWYSNPVTIHSRYVWSKIHKLCRTSHYRQSYA